VTDSEKLEAARRSGSLAAVIDVLREEGLQEPPAPTSAVEQVGLEDAAIRVAAGIAIGEKDAAKRRSIFRDLQPGMTVTSKGVAKTQLSRAEKIDHVKAWASSLTEEQRTEYMIGEKYAALSENAQDVIAEAFGELENDEYSTPVDVSSYDFEAEPVDVDLLPEDETETAGESFEVLEGEDFESFDIDDAEGGVA